MMTASASSTWETVLMAGPASSPVWLCCRAAAPPSRSPIERIQRKIATADTSVAPYASVTASRLVEWGI